MATNDEIFDNYANAINDGEFIKEFREGSNQTKFYTPAEIATLIEAREAAAKTSSTAKLGGFKRIVD